MDFTTVTQQHSEASSSQFWEAVDIWSREPHLTNRRILACEEILFCQIEDRVDALLRRFEQFDLSSYFAKYDYDKIDGFRLLSDLGIAKTIESAASTSSAEHRDSGTWLRVAKLLPRTPRIFSEAIEFTFMEKEKNRATFLQRILCPWKRSLGPDKAYSIHLDQDGFAFMKIRRTKEAQDSSSDSGVEWLVEKLFPRLLHWMASSPTNDARTSPRSLSLISASRYATLYNELKTKYGSKMIEIWPENTDPAKFVYEDVAIATYLLLLWEKEREERKTKELQSFVDLGCGNGLLVHILYGEGHPGKGIDLRKRKIWDCFPPDTPLEVCTIVPSSATVFPQTDWIVGNHSDELTPWIPVIAARSSADCRFFVLPCCPYEFDGRKYQRQCASRSQYTDYIGYVKSVCEECGFETFVDRLRIPSTKRICLIGWDRMRQGEEVGVKEIQIRQMINAKTMLIRRKVDDSTIAESPEAENAAVEWSCSFTPRDTVEPVRNCTRLDRSLVAKIVSIVADQLLCDGRRIMLDRGTERTWNAGRRLELAQLAASIPRVALQRLRRECGGLQTLLRNHSQVFRVVQGQVEFRIPGDEQTNVRKSNSNGKRKGKVVPLPTKVKPCWFQENHPDGCPAAETKCNYKH